MTALALLRANSLYVYYSDRPAVVGGNIPPEALHDMEVCDEKALETFVTKTVPRVPHAQVPTMLVLADDLCFSVPEDEKEPEASEKHVINITPFSHVATAHIVVKGKRYLSGTNQDMYGSVARALGAAGHPVNLVVSWSQLIERGISKGEMDSVTVRHASDAFTALKAAGFPYIADQTKESSADVAADKHKGKKKLPLGWIIFGAISLLYVAAMYWFFIRPGGS